jgi:hypothetical protein
VSAPASSGQGEHQQAELGVAEVLGSAESSVVEVAGAIADREGSVRLVVDEVQYVGDSAAGWLVDLARSLPDGASLVVA